MEANFSSVSYRIRIGEPSQLAVRATTEFLFWRIAENTEKRPLSLVIGHYDKRQKYCAYHKPISPLRLKSLASEKKKMGWAKESRLDTLVKPSIFPVEAFLSDLEG